MDVIISLYIYVDMGMQVGGVEPRLLACEATCPTNCSSSVSQYDLIRVLSNTTNFWVNTY